MPFDLQQNQKSGFVWLIAAFFSLSWAANLYEQILIFALLGLSLSLYRLARPAVRRLFCQNAIFATHFKCPASNLLEAFERICTGLMPLVICALYCFLVGPMLSKFLPPSSLRCVELSAYFNICWSLMQMIPVPPFEGWYLLDGILEMAMGYKGFSWSFFCSSIIGATLVACLVYLPFLDSAPQLVALLLFSMLSFSSLSQWQEQRGKALCDFDEGLQRQLAFFKHQLLKISISGPNSALEILHSDIKIAQKKVTPDSQSYSNICHLIALAFDLQGDTKRAFCVLNQVVKQLKGEPLKFLHELGYKQKRYDFVCSLAKSVYRSYSEPQIAVFNGLAYAHCQQKNLALRWLKCAKNEGYETWLLLQDPLFRSWSPQELALLKK